MLEITAATVASANTDTLRKMASQAKIQNIRSFKTAELREMLLGCIRVWNLAPAEATPAPEIDITILDQEDPDNLFEEAQIAEKPAHLAAADAAWEAARESFRKEPTKGKKAKKGKPSAHANCTHPATKAARAACRRSRKAEEIAGAQLAAAAK